MIRAGCLDKLILIEREGDRTVNAYGTVSTEWGVVHTLRAELLSAENAEADGGAGRSDERTLIFRTWFVGDLTVADRLRYAGALYDIQSLEELGRRKALKIRAVLRVQQ